jgi:hypothetical protein
MQAVWVGGRIGVGAEEKERISFARLNCRSTQRVTMEWS